MADEIRHRIVEVLPRLRRFALMLTGDIDRADDLVQEACVRALAHADQWIPGTRLDSWMYRIAQNLWIDRMRSKKVQGEVIDIDAFTHLTGSDGRDVVEHRLMLAHVSEKISELTPDQQLLIGLVCIDGMTYQEAADMLGIPIGTIMSRIGRARSKLNEAMNVAGSPAERTVVVGKADEQNTG